MSRGGDEDGFAARWSRLKQEAKAAPEKPVEEATEPAPDAAAMQAEADEAAREKTDAEILEELDLPDPDAMKMGDDFSAFMSSAVPTRLRNRALRRLWRSNPVLANLDRLNDYDGDFTDAATAGQVVTTAYQIGRGFIDRTAALLEKDEAESPVEAGAGEAPDPVDGTIEESGVEIAADVDAPDEDHPAKSRKSMRFTFDDGSA